jgi:hypothetical protein
MIAQKEIDRIFAPEPLDKDQLAAIAEIQAAAKALADILNRHMPDGQPKLEAINNLRGVIVSGELSIRYHWPVSSLSLVQ